MKVSYRVAVMDTISIATVCVRNPNINVFILIPFKVGAYVTR